VNYSELVPETTSAVALTTSTHQSRTQETILLVEDEAFVREITCEILEREGYRVLKACNAAEAKVVFGRYRKILQLLLTDVVLPGQNGRELANDLRALNPRLRALFISGYPENAVTQMGIAEDGMFYLPKPFSAESLLRKVRQVLARSLAEVAV
jgi:two-component system, cell cycle sensor histidine kinase and response regulator CckA